MAHKKGFFALNSTKILLIVTVILVVCAIVLTQEKQYYSPEEEVISDQKKPFLEGIEAHLDSIINIAVYNKGQVFKARALDDGSWVLTSKNDYPVDVKKIREMVLDASKLTVIEKKTANPERFHVLEVEDPKEESAQGTRMVFTTDSGKVVADFIIGKSRRTQTNVNADQVYVRHMSENQVWLASGNVAVDLSAKSLLGSELFALKENRIKSVERKFLTKDKNYELTRSSSKGTFTFSKPTNPKLGSGSAEGLVAIGRALENLDFQTVKARDEVAFVRKETITSRYTTFDGLALNVEAYRDKDDLVWITLEAEAVDTTKESEANDINKLVAPWAYAVTDKAGDSLTLTLKAISAMEKKEKS